MQLNHLDLSVDNVIQSKEFFENFFEFKSVYDKQSEDIAVLTNDEGFSLVLQKNQSNKPYPDSFHIGFILDNVEKVYQTYEKLKLNYSGFNSEITKNNRGTMFYFYAPGNILVEVSSKN